MSNGDSSQPRRRRRRRRGRRAPRREPNSPDAVADATAGKRDSAEDAANAPAASTGKGGQRSPRQRNGSNRLRTVHETSAGGLVINGIDGPRKDQVAALIGRTDRRGRMLWSLPKGHIEIGETAEQTAIREVAEETGVSGSVLAALGSIDYWFVTEGRRVHKTVHHYLMRFSSGELSDDDVEVSEVAWVPLGELAARLSYADERELAQVADELIDKLQNHGPTALPPLPAAKPWRRPQTHSRARRTKHASNPKNGRGLGK